MRLIVAVHERGSGTFETGRSGAKLSSYEGRPEVVDARF
jgi:hypothetical protein